MHNRLALKLVAPAELPDDAFGCALADTSTALGRHARRLTGRVPDADDLVQATVARCWAAPSSFRAGANLAAWARTIMRDSSISGRRRALPDATHPHNVLDPQSGGEGEQPPPDGPGCLLVHRGLRRHCRSEVERSRTGGRRWRYRRFRGRRATISASGAQRRAARLVDDREDPELAPAVRPRLDEVVCPHVPRILRSQPNAGPGTSVARTLGLKPNQRVELSAVR